MRIAQILTFLETQEIPFDFKGDADAEVLGFSSLAHYKEDSFTWIKTPQNIPEGFDLTRIQLAFIAEGIQGTFNNSICSPNSKQAFFSTIEHFYGHKEELSPVGEFTYISPKVKLGKNVRIGHNCTLDGEITVGDDTIICNNVVIVNRVTIGRNCEIQSGTVIGHDGFGYSEDENGVKTMVRHFGGVVIGNDVYMGMNNVIARGVIDDTVIGDGTKMSDLCHIGHNNVIGQNCAIINSAIFGSCHIEESAYLSYCVIKNQTHVGRGAFVGMAANVIKDVEERSTVVGNPARPLSRVKK